MNLRLIAILAAALFFSSCAKDDDTGSSTNFYSNADTSATQSELYGVWSIFNVEFEGLIADVPVQYQDCGRDFFVFSENGRYNEYLLQSSDCQFFTNSLNWDLSNGVITLSNEFNQSDDLVITDLSQNQLTFKSRLDIDEDGKLDIITLYAQRYQPTDIDFVSNTFNRNYDDAYENLISFTWQAYEGFSAFSRYEIYRSVGDNCSKDTAVLISTITDSNITEFTDLNPPAEEKLCYYLKIYTEQGLLGESILHSVTTYLLQPTPVGLNQPTVLNNQIQFHWQESSDPYFSHYELVYSNYSAGITASGSQEYTVANIYDINTTAYLDENPPYLENPYYVLYVHNIFGNRTFAFNSEVTTEWEVAFKRDEIIGFQQVNSYAIDPDEPVVYFYGRESGEGTSYNIHRFNYNTNQTEAISNLSPPLSTDVPIKVINSSNGKEIIIEQGSKLYVYNAVTLEYKYDLETGISINDFIYTSNGFWVLTNYQNVYTFTRDNANFDLIDSKPHFTTNQGSYNYQVYELSNNRVLIGHTNQSNSYLFDLGNDGMLTFNQVAPIPVMSNWNYEAQYNASGAYIINFIENRLYSTTTFSFLESFEQPHFSSGISLDGLKIFGSNNDPDWQITPESIHAKEAVIYYRSTQTSQQYSTIGYPHIVFENYNGDIMSISSGLKKDHLGHNINNKADLFIEMVNE